MERMRKISRPFGARSEAQKRFEQAVRTRGSTQVEAENPMESPGAAFLVRQ
ncbi:hypothetical protein TRIATDRAFT_313220 [Trichoderma atroviride IMI 206040]|uniref:Uncharacterized protein n=1 Tax=Hypocrea atroviridis (strain ATCC 20476 / IMI 206040) TaxID=452589 RepID=G9P9I2_HYPAI|nr:uncharacterized protein TRIATDRAFT_313220 [Trichoderma atroviride IMI 206040]EHK40305.1 hypothetical protein TRIATDRAFT_313220 [Trichoderma atroviride IMI 206040]